MALPKPPTAQQIQQSVMSKPSSANSPYYYGGGAPKPVVKPKMQQSAVGADNSPYYYGGGGTMPVNINPGGVNRPYTGATDQLGGPPTAPTWQEPDWNQLINANYLTQQAESQAGPMRADADVGLGRGLSTALWNYGWDPATMSLDKLGAAAPYLKQADIDAAAGNQYSALATIQRNQEQQRRMDASALAARGMLASGALTEADRASTEAAGSGRASAYSNLMDQVNRGVQQRATVEDQIAQMLQNARAQAAQFVSQNYVPSGATYMDPDYLTNLLKWAQDQANQSTTPAPPTAPPPPKAPAKAPPPTYYIGGPGGKGSSTQGIKKRF